VQRIPFYSPPNRLWGFDLGLLTQSADRFAERFASPIPGANEFLREVDANDPWVNSLLCALQPTDPIAVNAVDPDPNAKNVNIGLPARQGTNPRNYTVWALGKDRPDNCLSTLDPDRGFPPLTAN